MPAPRARRYTVIVVGDHSESIRQFQLHTRWLARSVLLLAALALVATAGVAHYVSLLAKGSENHLLKKENSTLRSQIHLVQDRVEHIAATLDRVERFDAKLRSVVAQLRGTERGLAIGPVGTRQDDPVAAAAPAPAAQDDAALPARLAALDGAATREESSLRQLQRYFDERRSLLASTPSTWPTHGWVTSDFGVRLDPYTEERMMHRGLDIATPQGQTVFAPSDGTVVFAGYENGYGKVLMLDHGYGMSTRYGHLSAIFVKPGAHVKRGARVAAVGNTGRSTGPHLHYEVRVNGIAENPRKFILQ